MSNAANSALIQIKHRFAEAVLFEGESGMSMRETLEKATAANADLRYANLRGANLRGANLRYANLRYANLRGADLRYANLRYANLSGADLRGADLRYANLRYANLSGADLRGADLRGADLSGNKLVGERPFFTIGPIGSRSDYLQAWITDAGVMIRAGCFFDTRDQFEIALAAEHGDNDHAKEYRAALVLIDKHAELWTPAIETQTQECVEVTA